MIKNCFRIIRIRENQIKTILKWAAGEGWNPGLHDAGIFYSADPNGFFMGFLDSVPVAAISAVSYDNKFGFLGLYIVKSLYRGKGYGLKIWKEAVKYLGRGNIGLDGVVSQQENYRKSGFKSAYRNIRYQCKSRKFLPAKGNIFDLKKSDLRKIASFDRYYFPAIRPTFLQNWIGQPDSFSFGYKTDNSLTGYAVLRKCRTGYKIGPLFAGSFQTAAGLFEAMNNALPESTLIYIDIPEVNREAYKLARLYRMQPCFETARMYTQQIPRIDLGGIYGVTTLELG